MHVLILGAGYAGLRVALNLSKLAGKREDLVQITLVDRNPYHQHIVLLHQTAAGADNEAEAKLSLEQILRRRAVRFHQGQVTRIEPLERHVVLHDDLSLEYDRLVVALGAQTNYGRVPGAKAYTWPLHSYDQARKLWAQVVACFDAAAGTEDAVQRKRLLTFAIVGGGYTGIQLAGELASSAYRLCRDYGVSSDEVRIALLERADMLLPAFGDWAEHEARRVLNLRGVSVHLNTLVERVEQGTLFVQGGKFIHAETIVWAAGIRAPQVLTDSGLTDDPQGRLPVDRYLRGTNPNQARIFAIGDCALVPDEAGNMVPATASYAMRQGEHLAETLMAEATGRAPRAYQPLRLGELVSLGPGYAVGKPLGLPSWGLSAAALKRGIEVWYLATLH